MVYFQCNHCPYSVRTKGSMKTHLGRYHGFGPFDCSLCGYRGERSYCLMIDFREPVQRHILESSHRGARHRRNGLLNTILDREVARCGPLAGPLPAARAVAVPAAGQLGGGANLAATNGPALAGGLGPAQGQVANPTPMPAPVVAAPAPLPMVVQVNPLALDQGVPGPLAPRQGQVGPAAADQDDNDGEKDEDDEEADPAAVIHNNDDDDDEDGEEDEDDEVVDPPAAASHNDNNNNNDDDDYEDEDGGSPGLRLMRLDLRMDLGLY
ncbi:hypothetical protein E4T39_06035 [Aureobasidium subglaciale]|nr:hypothetical protein E4T39_06035 [Aureobasidium subglaciale]